MTWYAYIDKQTGELKSTGTVRPAKVPDHLEEKELDGPVDFSAQEWDKEAREMVQKAPDTRPLGLLEIAERMTQEDISTVLKALGLTDERIEQLRTR